jgi:hypothetical protein
MTKTLVSVEYLRECFTYKAGKLYWRERPADHFKTEGACRLCNKRDVGREAGCLTKVNFTVYWRVMIKGEAYRRNKIIWAMHHGKWPLHNLIHKNRDPLDDRISNLKELK